MLGVGGISVVEGVSDTVPVGSGCFGCAVGVVVLIDVA